MRVLVVEDDRALGAVLRRGLQEEGYAVDVAERLSEADVAVAVNQYDVIVLDLGLPDGDGGTWCRAQRANGHDTPILVLTARSNTHDKVGSLDGGADDHLTKPFDFPELCARLRALLRRPPDARPTVFEVGSLRLDPARHQVTSAGTIVPLTAKEFAVLELLMRSPGCVVTRTDLLEHVWDEQYTGMSNVVDVHIASLRRKLSGGPRTDENNSSEDPIETIRGVGYRVGTP